MSKTTRAIDCMIIAPHMDDESLSCGGYIQRRQQEGLRVHVRTVFGRKYPGMTTQVEQAYSDAKEYQCFRHALSVLGVQDFEHTLYEEGEPQSHGWYKLLNDLEAQLRELQPTELVIPNIQDRNQDHQWLYRVCEVILRPWAHPYIRKVLVSQSPDGRQKETNYFVPMTLEQEERKLRAVECYVRERRASPHPRSPEMLRAWHAQVGSQCNEVRAEPYRLFYQRD